MRRRELISLLGGAATAWPLAARAQQGRKLPTIGFLGATTPSAQSQWTAAFVQRLRELDWIEGRDVAIEYRWMEGRNERAAEIMPEFAQLKVDVIVVQGTAASVTAKQATSVIPILFALAGDPVGSHLVASLARPGGNVTGLSNQHSDLAGKRLELCCPGGRPWYTLNGGGGIVGNGVGEARHSHCNHWSWTWRRDYSRLVATRGLPGTGIRTGFVL
jgi:putative ABC transport system substrate-binding protein